MRKLAHSQGMLLSINEAKQGRQHLHGRARHARQGSKLAEDIRSSLVRFLEQNMEVFAWKQEEMGGVDPTVITHRLNVNLSFKPVKQKRMSFAPERQKAINEEVSLSFRF